VRVWADGRAWTLPRLVYTWFAGTEPAGKVRHIATCVRGFRCANPLHLTTFRGRPRSRRRASPDRKLTPRQVRRIRELHAAGRSMNSLGKRYGITVGSIAHIVKRETYKNVGPTKRTRADVRR
jgi:hypothetical protein